jgi:hypothetical protein
MRHEGRPAHRRAAGRGTPRVLLEAGGWIVDCYGRTSWMMRRRPGKPIEMRSDLPSHVTSVRTTINATKAMVRRRGTVLETYSRDARPA